MGDGKSSAAAIDLSGDPEPPYQMTPEELIDFYNLEEYGVNKTGYEYGDALELEYTLVQTFFGNLPALGELDQIRDFIYDDLDGSPSYFLFWNRGEAEKKSNTIVNMQQRISNYLGIYVDFTGHADVSLGDDRIQQSLKTRFVTYTDARAILREAYKKNPLGYYLTEESKLFIKLFCESALDILVARRVKTQGSAGAPQRGRHTIFVDSDDDEEMETIPLRF